jgi:hypothetical protein
VGPDRNQKKRKRERGCFVEVLLAEDGLLVDDEVKSIAT